MKKIFMLTLTAITLTGLSAQNVGIGTGSPAQKLDVNGNLKVSGAIMPGGIAGTSGQVLISSGTNVSPTWSSALTLTDLQLTGNGAGLNKVLISDASGNASWTDPISFKAFHPNNTTFNHLVEDAVLFSSESFDDGNNVLPGYFTAPQNGTYHFDVSVKWGSNSAASNYVQVNLEKCNFMLTSCTIVASSKMNDQFAAQQAFGVDIKLQATDRVRVMAYQTNTSFQSRVVEGVDVNGNMPTYFSGHLIR